MKLGSLGRGGDFMEKRFEVKDEIVLGQYEVMEYVGTKEGV